MTLEKKIGSRRKSPSYPSTARGGSRGRGSYALTDEDKIRIARDVIERRRVIVAHTDEEYAEVDAILELNRKKLMSRETTIEKVYEAFKAKTKSEINSPSTFYLRAKLLGIELQAGQPAKFDVERALRLLRGGMKPAEVAREVGTRRQNIHQLKKRTDAKLSDGK